MTRWFIALLLVLTPTMASALPTWFSGAELGDVTVQGGDFGGTSSGSPTADTAIVRTGTYSLKCPSSAFVESMTSLNLSTIWTRGYVYVAALPASDEIIWEAKDSGGGARTQIWLRTNGTISWADNGGAYVATSTAVLLVKNWNLIETKMVADAATGGVELKMHNHTEFTSLASNTGATTFDRMGFGPRTGGGTTIQYDDLSLNAGGYPGPGRVVARSGIAGTPTYDAWTKSSGSTIDTVWVDTPANLTTDASVTVSSDKQTILIHSFSTTQTGHGPHIIRPGDTINGINGYAWIQNTASPPQLVRRVGGVDTFTQVGSNGINGDGFFRNSGHGAVGGWVPWTTTLTNLNSLEFGGRNQAGGGSSARIYDVWVMVEYTSLEPHVKVRQ